jgi:hypothetical protein
VNEPFAPPEIRQRHFSSKFAEPAPVADDFDGAERQAIFQELAQRLHENSSQKKT